jgi:hypothetical protein
MLQTSSRNGPKELARLIQVRIRKGPSRRYWRAALPGPTTYHCELRDANGDLIAQSTENHGGGMIPDV